jgi:hypothetical protein
MDISLKLAHFFVDFTKSMIREIKHLLVDGRKIDKKSERCFLLNKICKKELPVPGIEPGPRR